MRSEQKARTGLRESTRRVFLDAAGPVEPDVRRLVGRLPAILAEAELRRASRAQFDALAAVLPLARKAIPRLAVATAALLVVAFFLGGREADDALDTQAGLDGYLLTGELSDGTSDLLLEAIAKEADDHG